MCGYVTAFPIMPDCRCPCHADRRFGRGLFGLFLECMIVRRLYHRLFDSLVATWGISLITTQGMLILRAPSPASRRLSAAFRSVARRSRSTGSRCLRWPSLCWAASTCCSCTRGSASTRERPCRTPPWPAPSAPATRSIPSPSVWVRRWPASPGPLRADDDAQCRRWASFHRARSSPSWSVVRTSCSGASRGRGPRLHPVAATTSYGQLFGVMSLLAAVILVVRVMPKGISGWVIAADREVTRMRAFLALLDGPQTFGAAAASGCRHRCLPRGAALSPVVDGFTITNLTYFLVWVFMALDSR